MTRPLYEPSDQRQIRKLGFSSDQLFRRPSPPSNGTDLPWCRLYMESPNQTVSTPPAAPAIEFADSINDYTATFDVQSGVSGIPLSVMLLEDGLYHVCVYIAVDAVPTNGFQLAISGDNTIMEMGDDYTRYIAPLAYPYTQLGVTFRGGPSRGLNVYAFVRQRSGNGTFDILWPDTFMEIYKFGSVAGNAT